jgi:hypothetical protein
MLHGLRPAGPGSRNSITPDVVLLSYTAHARWNYQETSATFLCSTVYVIDDGQWRVALHQQTDASDGWSAIRRPE